MHMTLVIGATGVLGLEIVRRLRAEGRPVRALVRSTTDDSKRQALRAMGADLVTGDMKDEASMERACHGATHVISTASSTLSRAEGDSIETVDRLGQITAIRAAKKAGVSQFVLVSFPESAIDYPLQDAKREAERALQESGMTYTILRVTFFWEIWCSPALGFDVAGRKARIFGNGDGLMNWISLGDVAAVAVRSLGHEAARNRVLTFGGPDVVSQLDIVRLFEKAVGEKFEIDRVPVEALRQQHAAATDPMQKSFAALMLIIAEGGWVFDHEPIRKALHPKFTSIHDVARAAGG
jgi:uncharacterized protein YbjT (DUF2867 family)